MNAPRTGTTKLWIVLVACALANVVSFAAQAQRLDAKTSELAPSVFGSYDRFKDESFVFSKFQSIKIKVFGGQLKMRPSFLRPGDVVTAPDSVRLVFSALHCNLQADPSERHELVFVADGERITAPPLIYEGETLLADGVRVAEDGEDAWARIPTTSALRLLGAKNIEGRIAGHEFNFPEHATQTFRAFANYVRSLQPDTIASRARQP